MPSQRAGSHCLADKGERLHLAFLLCSTAIPKEAEHLLPVQATRQVPVLTRHAPRARHAAAVLSWGKMLLGKEKKPLQASGDTLHPTEISAFPPLLKSGRSCDAGIHYPSPVCVTECYYFMAVRLAEPKGAVPCTDLLPPTDDTMRGCMQVEAHSTNIARSPLPPKE